MSKNFINKAMDFDCTVHEILEGLNIASVDELLCSMQAIYFGEQMEWHVWVCVLHFFHHNADDSYYFSSNFIKSCVTRYHSYAPILKENTSQNF